MALKDTMNDGIKAAMKAKDQARLRTLRSIKTALMNLETEAGRAAELTQAEELKLLEKMVKQRRDSLEQYTQAGRADLAQTEQEEITIIEEFLPQPLTEAELVQELKAVIQEVGAESPKDLGKVMKVATARLVGRAEGKTITQKVKELLS